MANFPCDCRHWLWQWLWLWVFDFVCVHLAFGMHKNNVFPWNFQRKFATNDTVKVVIRRKGLLTVHKTAFIPDGGWNSKWKARIFGDAENNKAEQYFHIPQRLESLGGKQTLYFHIFAYKAYKLWAFLISWHVFKSASSTKCIIIIWWKLNVGTFNFQVT